MAGELISQDRQVELQGLLMGPGTAYHFHRFDPWLYPDLASGDVGRSGRHGVASGRDLLRTRRVPMEVSIVTSGKEAVIQARHALVAAFAPVDVDVPLVFRAGDTTYRLNGRPRLADGDLIKARAGVGVITARFTATDPLIYGDTEQSVTVGFPTGGVGRTYDLTFDRVYGASGEGGIVNLTNDGTMETSWRAEIVGPWVNPTIENLATGDRLTLTISIGASDRLILDSADESVLLGSAHRLNVVDGGSVWPTLAPGENELRFGGASGSGSATVYTRSAWL